MLVMFLGPITGKKTGFHKTVTSFVKKTVLTSLLAPTWYSTLHSKSVKPLSEWVLTVTGEVFQMYVLLSLFSYHTCMLHDTRVRTLHGTVHCAVVSHLCSLCSLTVL